MVKYRIRKLHAPRGTDYAHGKCDALYVRSMDVSWITVRDGVLIVTTDEEHLIRPQIVVDIMKEPPPLHHHTIPSTQEINNNEKD